MANLRWILLLAGLLFLAGLTAWEMRRPRQARRGSLEPGPRAEPQLGQMHEFDSPSQPQPHAARTATPSSHQEIPALGSPLVISLDGPIEPPVVHPVEPEPAYEPVYEHAHEERMEGVEEFEHAHPHRHLESAPETASEEMPAIYAEEAMPSEVPEPIEEQPSVAVRPGEIVVPVLLASEPIDPIVEWPPEDQRHILSVRVVALNPERLSGRPLRQALAACGFVHGRFGIYHQPGADGRALISAANLSKPGVFDPSSMDFQRFRGLGLFAVLPGPLPPAAALDHLLDTASDLADRLHARVQDEQGQPLDEDRLEALARTVQDISNGALRREPAA